MKRIVTGVLAGLMLLSLAACSKDDVTAESLLEGVRAKDGSYVSMTMHMDMTGEADGTDMGFDIMADYETSGDVYHVGNLEGDITATGMSLEMSGEMWGDEEYTYTNMTILGQETGWTRDYADGSSVSGNLVEGLMDSDTEAVLEEHKRGEDYVVSWTVDLSEAMGSFGELAGTEDMDEIDQDVTIRANFDEKTKALKSLSMDVGEIEVDGGNVALKLDVTFNEIGGDKTLTIPDEVVNADYDDVDAGFDVGGWDVDDDYVGDSTLVGEG